VYDVEGARSAAGSATTDPLFKVPHSPDLAAFNRTFPDRLALKHAHSGANVEQFWGQHVLLAIQFALYCLNDYGTRPDGGAFTRPPPRVIAAGVSNGGGAALAAAEQDDPAAPLIDGVVVSEPQVQPTPRSDFVIRYGDAVFTDHSRSLLDTVTLMNVYA